MLKRAAATQSLYEFSRNMSGAAKPDDVLWAAAAHIHKMLGRGVVLLVQDGANLKPWAAWPLDTTLDTAETSAAHWALQKTEAAGRATGTLPNIRFQFRPLVTTRGVVGVCGFEPPSADAPMSAEEERTLTAILDQTAIALDRAMLADVAVKAAAFAENERVRDALLASLSHDLKTPLASITGAVTTLRQLGDKMPPESQHELLASIEEETARLSRFLVNLLDMSRIESGAVKIRRDWVDVADVIRAATDRSRKAFAGQPVQVSLAPDLGFIRGDAHLLEQVVFNLLDNAHKYGGQDGATVHGRREGGELVISVTDEGPGVKPGDLEHIFEKFWRGGRSDGRSAGTGLGLSICRGLVQAMGGTIVAQSPAIRRRGTRIVMRFPVAEPQLRGDLA